MTKKILASLMAALLAFGVFAFVVAAEEPETPEYTGTEYQIVDLIAAVEEEGDVYLQPADVIRLAQAPAEDPQTPEDPAATEDQPTADDPQTPADEPAEAVLIVEYLPGVGGIPSDNGNTRFVDYDGDGYAIRGLGEYTDYAYKATERRTGYAIDFVNEKGYAFKQWKIQSIYSGKEFNRIVLEAEWEEPVLSGWDGFTTMMRSYIKTIIDYVIQFLSDWFLQLGDFLVGSST